MKKLLLLLLMIGYIPVASGMNSWGFGSGPDLILNAGWRLLFWSQEDYDSANCACRVSASTGIAIPPLLPKNERLSLALGQAAADGDCNLVERYLKEDADVNKEYYCTGTPLMRAMCGPQGAPNSDAFWKIKRSICDILIKAGAQVNAKYKNDGQTALMQAVKLDPSLVEFLINNGADVNAVDNRSRTVMYHATHSNSHDYKDDAGRFKICDLLIKNKADAKTATLWACIMDNHKEAAQLLIKHGTPIKGALFDAISWQKTDMAYLLLKAGAQVNETDHHSRTPLILAAQKKDEALCEMLVKHYRQTNKCVIALHDLLLQCDSSGKRACDYLPLDFLKPDSITQVVMRKKAILQEQKLDLLRGIFDCKVCLDERPMNNWKQLACGHGYCQDCILDIIDLFKKERQPKYLECPDADCKEPFTEHDIEELSGSDHSAIELWNFIKLQKWIAQQSDAKQCPKPNCAYMFLSGDQSESFTCPSCSYEYCSNCLAPHNPATISCAAYKASILQAEKETMEWKYKNTRPCPRCYSAIERSAGCWSMLCTHCEKFFCYECLHPLAERYSEHACKPMSTEEANKKHTKHAAIENMPHDNNTP